MLLEQAPNGMVCGLGDAGSPGAICSAANPKCGIPSDTQPWPFGPDPAVLGSLTPTESFSAATQSLWPNGLICGLDGSGPYGGFVSVKGATDCDAGASPTVTGSCAPPGGSWEYGPNYCNPGVQGANTWCPPGWRKRYWRPGDAAGCINFQLAFCEKWDPTKEENP